MKRLVYDGGNLEHKFTVDFTTYFLDKITGKIYSRDDIVYFDEELIYSNLDSIKQFIKEEGNINLKMRYNYSPLMESVKDSHHNETKKNVELFLINGAKTEIRSIWATTALYIAGMYGNNISLNLLISYGANIDVIDYKCNNMSVLSSTIYFNGGFPKCSKTLVKYGANTGFSLENEEHLMRYVEPVKIIMLGHIKNIKPYHLDEF